MQIISGKYRGKKLKPMYNEITRPTKNRVRESVFNVLGKRVRDAVVLDLFAGSGVNSAECLSRGASEVIANDNDEKATAIIKQNLSGLGNGAVITGLDYMDALATLKNRTFDIIFLDPPYESDFGPLAIDYLTQRNMLSKDAIIVFETDTKFPLALPRIIGQRIITGRSRDYGRTRIYFLSQKEKQNQGNPN